MSVAAVLRSNAIDIGPRAALHTLNRLGYGPRPADVRRVLARGLEKYVDDQLHPGPDAELDTRLRPLDHDQLPDLPGPLHLQRGQPDHRADRRRVPGREADPLRSRPEPAPGSPRRLLVQPLQRLHRRRVRPLQHHGVRAGGDPSLRARALPRPAGRGGRAPGDAVLPRQLHEPRRRDPGRPRHPRHQRELRTRAARAAHRRRRRRLQPERRAGGGAGLHGVGDRQHQGRGELRLPRRPARPRGEERLRLRRRGGRRQGRRRPAPRLPVDASGDRALHLLAAGPALRGRRSAGAHRRAHGVHVPLHRGRSPRGDADAW